MNTASTIGWLTIGLVLALSGCASQDTYPESYVGDSVDDPTIFVGAPQKAPLSEADRAAFETRIEELRFVLTECDRTNTDDLLGLWRSQDNEVFFCRAGPHGTWVFYPMDPFQPGGTTARGTERMFLSLNRSAEEGFFGEVDALGMETEVDDEFDGLYHTLSVQSYLTDGGTKMVLVHEPDLDSMSPLSFFLERGLDEEGELSLERELALRMNRLGLMHHWTRPID